jgi:hypothetical protein
MHQPLLAPLVSCRATALLPLILPLQQEKHESSLWRLQRLGQLLLLAVLQSMPSQLHSSLLPKQLLAPPQPKLPVKESGPSDFSSTFSLFKSPWQTCSECMYDRARAMSIASSSSSSCSTTAGKQQESSRKAAHMS